MPNPEPSHAPNARFDATRRASAPVPTVWDRLLWICPIAFLGAAAALLWLFDFTFWTALGVALLLACPTSIAWALLAQRLGKPPRDGR